MVVVVVADDEDVIVGSVVETEVTCCVVGVVATSFCKRRCKNEDGRDSSGAACITSIIGDTSLLYSKVLASRGVVVSMMTTTSEGFLAGWLLAGASVANCVFPASQDGVAVVLSVW